MKIESIRMEPIRPESARALRHAVPGTTGGSTDQPARPVERIERADRVQISDAGRRRAEQLDAAQPARPLSEARVHELRQRVESGVYDRAEVIETVARRMLALGDV
jgi:anti-sigma28 factor (negative regulator of flagellin synthesis)